MDELLEVARRWMGSLPRDQFNRLLTLTNERYAAGLKDGVPKWRPIGAAPMDGREILILANDMIIQARYEPGRWSDDTPIAPAEYDGPVWCGFDDHVNFEIEETPHGNYHGAVTHWMPVPELPA